MMTLQYDTKLLTTKTAVFFYIDTPPICTQDWPWLHKTRPYKWRLREANYAQ